jgi:hypothetical protein
METYVQTKEMALPWECCCSVFDLVQHAVLLCLQWPLAQLFPLSCSLDI